MLCARSTWSKTHFFFFKKKRKEKRREKKQRGASPLIRDSLEQVQVSARIHIPTVTAVSESEQAYMTHPNKNNADVL